MRRALWVLVLLGCGGEASDDDGPTCDPERGRAPAGGPYTCDAAPAFVTVESTSRFDIFTYEASHPLSGRAEAFPCANEPGAVSYQAPMGSAEACSVDGVRPWHTVTWADAKAACEAIGWRLCTEPELTRACAGPRGNAYTFGNSFDPKKCNLREAFVAEGNEFASESPTGHFPECVSAEGAFDLTGNLREWTSAPDEGPMDVHQNQAGGWRTVAQRHESSDLACNITTRAFSLDDSPVASPDVGFRCCRDAQ